MAPETTPPGGATRYLQTTLGLSRSHALTVSFSLARLDSRLMLACATPRQCVAEPIVKPLDKATLDLFWHDSDARETRLREVVAERLGVNPPPRFDDCVVASYFF